jgi:putative FmdB family regulatory protein
MPIYDYSCDLCGKEFEIIQKMNEPDLSRYPGCDNLECSVKKVISKNNFQLKGSGWAKDLYGK